MPDPVPQANPLSLTREEHRYLRGLVRRTALPWVGAAALAGVAGGLVLASHTGTSEPPADEIPIAAAPGAAPEAADALPEGPDDAAPTALEARLEAARAELEKRLAGMRGEIDGVESRLATRLEKRWKQTSPAPGVDPAFVERVAQLEGRVDRLAELEGRVDRIAQRAAPTGAVPATGSDLGGVLERLFNIEARMEKQDAGIQTFQADLLDRVYNIEASRDERVRAAVESEHRLIERLENLEGRFFNLEKNVASRTRGGSAPAAPR